MNEQPKRDTPHEILNDMAEQDAEQPGDTPTGTPSEPKRKETEDAPRETD